VLVELSKMEQRYDAALCVIRDGFTVTEVAQKFGVSRENVQVWLLGYEAEAQKPSPRSPIVPVSRPSRPSGVATSNKSGNQASHRVVGGDLARIPRNYGSSAVDFGIGKI
jgi:transposase-like protein